MNTLSVRFNYYFVYGLFCIQIKPLKFYVSDGFATLWNI
jgi:hypothetical protein